MRQAALAALFCAFALASAPRIEAQTNGLGKQEQDDLSRALADAGGSPKEDLRALEKHLEKYPDSPRKAELERAAALAALEARDDAALVLYGERVLARKPDDLQMLDPVSRALAAEDSNDAAGRALKYARRYETLAREILLERPHDAEWQNRGDQAIARALTYQARATLTLGRAEEALGLAQRAFLTFPNAEAARQIAKCEERLGHTAETVRALADAFTVPDAHNTDADRARDRGRMGELYRKAHGSEAGLGDLLLEAYDRNMSLVQARELRMRASDPNSQLTDPMQFTLSALEGAPLHMAELKGKIVILDLWATWCGPCRAQHPLYEQVKQRFAGNRDVVFLSIDSDEDRAAVKPFLDQVKWSGPVYFEDGLARALKITGIPATIIIGRDGQVFSRMSGYVPDQFVDSLAGKIKDALGK